MKIITAMRTGAYRTAGIWRIMLLIWFVTLVITAIFVSPLKNMMYTGFGSSMITERLRDGIFPEAFTDLGLSYRSMISVLTSGFFSLILINFMLNAFFTAGLFDCIRMGKAEISIREFLKACAKNFLPYLIILIMTVLLMVFSYLIISAVMMIFIDMESDRIERILMITGAILTSVYILILPVMLLIADYSRAWNAVNDNKSALSAFGNGLSLSFGHFRSSWLMMFMLIIINALYLWLVFSVLSEATPASGMGVFAFFIASQLLFMGRIMIKTYRYSCVTSLMEQCLATPTSHSGRGG